MVKGTGIGSGSQASGVDGHERWTTYVADHNREKVTDKSMSKVVGKEGHMLLTYCAHLL